MVSIDIHPFTKTLMASCLIIAAYVLIAPKPDIILTEVPPPPTVNFDHIEVKKEDYFVVFVIPTMAHKVQSRETIRATWANMTAWSGLDPLREQYSYFNFKIMFIIGDMRDDEPYSQEFLDEASKHNDIFIVSGLVEHRLVLKYKVLWALKRSQHLYNYKFLIKTDDDILVNLPQLMVKLNTVGRHMTYGGECFQRYGGFSGYPRWVYCSGGGYVLSYDMVSSLFKLDPGVHNVPFRPEDGYVGWLVYNVNKNLNFTLKVPKKFGHVLKTYGYDCGIYDHWFYHYVGTPKKMTTLFQNINTNSWVKC